MHRGHQAGRSGTKPLCAWLEPFLHKVGPWGARVVGGRRGGWCVHGGDGSHSLLVTLFYVPKNEPSNDCMRKSRLGETVQLSFTDRFLLLPPNFTRSDKVDPSESFVFEILESMQVNPECSGPPTPVVSDNEG